MDLAPLAAVQAGRQAARRAEGCRLPMTTE